MTPEMIKKLTSKSRLERLTNAQDQAEMMVDEVRQLLRLYQPPSYASPTVPTIDELVALTKAFDEAVVAFGKKIVEHRADLLAETWSY